MSKTNKAQIVEQIKNHNLFIWGARMTGLGAKRFFESNNITVKGFIDSDPAFENKLVSGLTVHDPNSFISLINSEEIDKKTIAIVIAVSLKEAEILVSYGDQFKGVSFYSFQNEATPSYTIDILGSCNLSCASCPHSIEENNVPKGSMTLDTFEKVFEKVTSESNELTHVSLYSWGEPLIHPYLHQIVDIVHDKNIAVALSSNLSLNLDSKFEKLIKSNPDYLKISLSGYYPEAYNATHQGGDITLVKSNLYKLRYLIDKYKATTLVDINYHLYRDNSGKNLDKMQALADELGFILSKTYALIMPLERVLNHLDGKPDYWTKKLEDNLLVSIDEGIKASSDVKLSSNSCPFRENQININADLTVPVCCTTFFRDETIVSKNYLADDINEINHNKSKISLCDRCMRENLPQYNLGFNQKKWKAIANKKTITDEAK
jgi:MoaA/NifB/PqqE/SkfB family radical SAM enzyme